MAGGNRVEYFDDHDWDEGQEDFDFYDFVSELLRIEDQYKEEHNLVFKGFITRDSLNHLDFSYYADLMKMTGRDYLHFLVLDHEDIIPGFVSLYLKE